MIERKDKILLAALELFAKGGYSSVSTSKIAKKASVSEGLIFRHYGSKKGLLNAIIEKAKEKTINLFAPIILQADPKKAIKMAIMLPYDIPEQEYSFWRLQFKLKWESDYDTSNKMEPLINKLGWAFAQLNYKMPKKEAEVLAHVIEGISIGILCYGKESQKGLKSFLIQKYNL